MYELEFKKFGDAENGLFGVFVSHSNAPRDSKLLHELDVFAKSQQVHLVYDRMFLKAGDDFRLQIHRYANCNAAIVLLTKNSVESAWVNYEIGMLHSKNIPVFLYDPDGVTEKSCYQYDYQIKQFLPAFTRKEDVIRKIKEISVYRGLYPIGTRNMSVAEFNEHFNSADASNRIEKCMLSVTSNVFDKYKEWFRQCRIGALIIHFGQLDEDDSQCRYGTDGFCTKRNAPCALKQITSVSQCGNGMCTILNNVIYTGSILYAGETDVFDRNSGRVSTAVLKLSIPVHSRYGVKFKLIFDAETEKVKNYVAEALTTIGLNPSVSSTGGANRIYCTIGEDEANGIFVLKSSFNDNFVCPLVCCKT